MWSGSDGSRSGSSDESGDEGGATSGPTVVDGILHVPDGTTTIPSSAFEDRTDFAKVVLPSSATAIGENAFRGCTSLVTLDLPDNTLTSIGASAFEGCTSLATLHLPDTLTFIGGFGFYGCTRLTTLDLPDTLTSIGNADDTPSCNSNGAPAQFWVRCPRGPSSYTSSGRVSNNFILLKYMCSYRQIGSRSVQFSSLAKRNHL